MFDWRKPIRNCNVNGVGITAKLGPFGAFAPFLLAHMAQIALYRAAFGPPRARTLPHHVSHDGGTGGVDITSTVVGLATKVTALATEVEFVA